MARSEQWKVHARKLEYRNCKPDPIFPLKGVMLTGSKGNDDQMFWGIAAMTAAEYKFPNRPSGDTWLTLAEGVFYDQSGDSGQGWETTICEGGLRWQKFIAQSGYVMKNAVSNGGFMMLAARLALYNQKDSYGKWAEKVWNWANTAGMIDNSTWTVYDSISKGSGGKVADCTGPDHTQWTYNYGTFMTGCAYMYAYVSWSFLQKCFILFSRRL